MHGDMDFDAGAILDGRQTLDEAGLSLLKLVREVAAGHPSKPEALGHREYFLMYKHQDTPSLAAGCRA
jgi:altronate hydrolase